jgi:hypothetical protein
MWLASDGHCHINRFYWSALPDPQNKVTDVASCAVSTTGRGRFVEPFAVRGAASYRACADKTELRDPSRRHKAKS